MLASQQVQTGTHQRLQVFLPLLHAIVKLQLEERKLLVRNSAYYSYIGEYHLTFYIMCTVPQIDMFPEDKQAVEGEEVVFSVKVSGAPQPKITWYHNGEEVVADYAKELAADGSLTIFSAELKHSGVYQLVATNMAGSVDKRVCLFVQYEDRQSVHGEKKQITFPGISVEEFGDYVCKCHANDNDDFKNQYSVRSNKRAGLLKSIIIIVFLICIYNRR